MVHKNYSSTVGLALLLMGATVAEVQFAQAQTAAFQLPASVPQGTQVRIDGSSSMAAVNSVLKQQFEQKFPGTQVKIAANGTPAGVQAVLNGKADIAAIGRPLNDAEKAQGLKTVPVGRDKIAILIGANNPFNKSLTIDQFAKMFRGEIKNWSEVGGQNAPIKFVDRPDSSDTRQAFKGYPVFKQGKFATGATALRLTQDSTKAVVVNLGNNGIGYATANQLKGLTGVKVVPMHGTPPTDPRYPFSQALYYVYKDGSNPAVQAFLGLATNAPGQTAIEKAGVAAPVASANAAKGTPAQKMNTGDQSATNPGNTAQGDNPLAFLFPGDNAAGTGAVAETGTGLPKWLWWLLPIASGAALLWMLASGRRNRRDRGAVGTFNPPEYSADYSNRDNTVHGAPYVEGGYDPLQTNSDSTNLDTPNADLAWNTETNRTGNLDLEPNVTGNVDRAHPFGNAGNLNTGNLNTGNLSGAALGGAAVGAGAAAAAWSTFGDRPKQSRVVLKSRSSQEVEAFWDIPAEERQAIRQQGGEKLALRLYDVTDIDLANQPAHSVQQFDCDELTQRQRLSIGLPDRDYLAEIGYLTADNQWLSLARSTHVRVPAANPFGDAARGTVDSAKSFLSDDRDTEAEPTIKQPSETQATDPNSPTWFQRVTHHENDSANHVTQTSDPVVNRTSPEPQTTDAQSPSWFQRITHQVTDAGNDVTQAGGAAPTAHGDGLAGGATAAAGAGAAAWSFVSGQRNSDAPRTDATEATGFTTGTASTVTPDVNPFVTGETLDATLPTSIGEGRLVLTPRNARWAYASWDLPRSLRSRIDRNTGDNLVLRLYDVTDGGSIPPARYEQHDIDDMALSCDVPIPLSDRTYIAEMGYVDANHQWTRLARSAPAHIPAN